MMSVTFGQPLWLLLLPLALLPLRLSSLESRGYSSISRVPVDPLSRAFGVSLTVAGILGLAGLLLGLAGPAREGREIQRVGEGANIVLLIDRSNSMDHSFAGRTPAGGEESKSHAAERLLADFVSTRPHDRFGVAAFSTAPLFVEPLTDNREATLAALRALSTPALAYTHVSKGLALALSLFRAPQAEEGGARIVLLVSDGAAVVDPDSERLLRTRFRESGAHLYWLFLRTANTPGLFETPEDPRDDTPQIRPERHLHLFFETLGVPYRAFEAESADVMARAMREIDRIERLPMRYRERVPRLPLQAWCYGTAALAIGWLLAVKLAEVRT